MSLPIKVDNIPLIPVNTGHYATDCDLGKRHATDLVVLMGHDYSTMRLRFVAEAIVKEGGGVSAGFFQQIADHAVRGIE